MIRVIPIVFFVCFSVFADIIDVPSPKLLTIQSAIDSASTGDTILVQPDKYKENINFSGKSLFLTSIYLFDPDSTNITNTIIEGKSSAPVITVKSGEDSNTVLNGFTIQNGLNYLGNGGGIACSDFSHLKLRNNHIIGNNAGKGGGIFCFNHSTISLENCQILDNAAGFEGGGLYCERSSRIELNNVQLYGNVANEEGGGLLVSDSSMAILNETSFISNVGLKSGGGIYCDLFSKIKINGAEFNFNISSGNGGGLYCSESEIDLLRVYFQADSATNGGAVYVKNSSNVSITQADFMRNRASEYGGGIYLIGSSVSFSKTKIAYNSAIFSGGGLYFTDSYPNLKSEDENNIFLNHAGRAGTDIFAEHIEPVSIQLDTFTLAEPDSYIVMPLDTINIEVNNGFLNRSDQDLYVSPGGNDLNDGSSPGQPLKTLAAALTKINSDSVEHLSIFLDKGIYTTQSTGEFYPVNLKDNIHIRGTSTAETVLDARHLSEVLSGFNDSGCTVSDLTVTNGLSQIMGGGLHSLNSEIKFSGVLVNNNMAYSGGAVYADQSSQLIFSRSTITKNQVLNGDGVADRGGLLVVDSKVQIANTIIWDNAGRELSIYSENDTANVALAYSNLTDDPNKIDIDTQSLSFLLIGNIHSYPSFRAPDKDDFRLSDTSLCIDAGAQDTMIVYNLNKDTLFLPKRSFIGTAPDIGAFEFGDPLIITGLTITPGQYELRQNYPNPFNPVTSISYRMADRNHIKLEVFDISGRLVSVLIDRVQSAGMHTIVFDGTALATGIYFYRLMSGPFMATRRMFLIK